MDPNLKDVPLQDEDDRYTALVSSLIENGIIAVSSVAAGGLVLTYGGRYFGVAAGAILGWLARYELTAGFSAFLASLSDNAIVKFVLNLLGGVISTEIIERLLRRLAKFLHKLYNLFNNTIAGPSVSQYKAICDK